MKFYCFSLPVCDALLWQLQQTNAHTKMLNSLMSIQVGFYPQTCYEKTVSREQSVGLYCLWIMDKLLNPAKSL